MRLLDLIVPPACLVCRAPGATLCRGCRAGLPWLAPDRCPRCALPLPCGARCPAGRAAFERAWAPLAHDGTARALVHALKLKGHTAAAELMAAQIAANVPTGLLAEGALVPVPGTRSRERARGFDTAERIARALSRRTGQPLADVLRARPGEAAQVGAGRAQRLRRGAIDVRRRPPEHAILVDDVHTTGATLDACARALRAAGSRTVVAVTFTRTLG